MIIALIGNDGSGKTSIASELATTLRKHHRAVNLLEEFNYPLLGFLRKLQGDDGLQTNESQDEHTKPSLAVKILPYVMWLETTLQVLRLRLFKRGAIAIKDRCSYDYLATWRELHVASPMVEFLYKHAPMPDVVFYVSVDAKTSFARRKLQTEKDSGKDLEFYHAKKSLYEQIYQTGKIMRVDNNGEMNDTINTIIRNVELRASILQTRVIAISGLDGAGKTTTITNLSEILSRLNIPHHTMHFYYNYIIIKMIKKLKGSRPVDESIAHQKSIDNEQKSAAKGRSKFWKMFVIGDALLQYYWTRLAHPRSVMIYDRFFPDFFVSFEFLGVDYSKQTLRRIFPKPNVYFLQIADYKVLHKRKPEHTLDFFKICYEKYIALAREEQMIMLDSTTKKPAEIVQELMTTMSGAAS